MSSRKGPTAPKLSFIKGFKGHGRIPEKKSSTLSSSMSLKWSTPDRRAGAKPLKMIPAEIYLMIFDNIEPPSSNDLWSDSKRTLASLSLACSFFRAICQPRLFSYLTFYGQNTNNGPRIKKQDRWRALLDAGDARCVALGSHVKTLTYVSWTAPSTGEQWLYTALLQKHIQAAARLKNVTTLILSHCVVRESVLRTLTTLPALVDLSFCRCVMRCDSDSNTSDTVPSTGWTSLSITGGHDAGMLQDSPSVLARMIDRRNLRSLTLDNGYEHLVRDIFLSPSEHDSKLETLDVRLAPPLTPEFLATLRQERCLTNLAIRGRRSAFCEMPGPDTTYRMTLWSAESLQPLSCIVTLKPSVPWKQSLDVQAVLDAWSPAMPRRLAVDIECHDVDTSPQSQLAIIAAMLRLLARSKAHGDALVENILASADTLAVDIDGDDEDEDEDIGARVDEDEDEDESDGQLTAISPHVNPHISEGLRGVLDRTLDDTFPALTGVKMKGEIQWYREGGAREWRRGTKS